MADSMKIQKRGTAIATPYRELLERIVQRYAEGQAQAVRSVKNEKHAKIC